MYFDVAHLYSSLKYDFIVPGVHNFEIQQFFYLKIFSFSHHCNILIYVFLVVHWLDTPNKSNPAWDIVRGLRKFEMQVHQRSSADSYSLPDRFGLFLFFEPYYRFPRCRKVNPGCKSLEVGIFHSRLLSVACT